MAPDLSRRRHVQRVIDSGRWTCTRLGGSVVARGWRKIGYAFAGAAAGVLAAVLAARVAFGSSAAWERWITLVPELLSTTRAVLAGNCSLSAGLFEATGWDLSAPLLAVALLAVAAAGLGGSPRSWLSRSSDPAVPDCSFERTYVAAGLGAAAMVLSSRLVWLHYFVLLLPLPVFLLQPVARARRRTTLSLLVPGVATIALTSGARYLVLDSGLVDPARYAVILAAAAGVLLVAGLHALREMASRPAIAAARDDAVQGVGT